jgi:hypothetical protein
MVRFLAYLERCGIEFDVALNALTGVGIRHEVQATPECHRGQLRGKRGLHLGEPVALRLDTHLVLEISPGV